MTISYNVLKTPSEMLALPHKLLTLLTVHKLLTLLEQLELLRLG